MEQVLFKEKFPLYTKTIEKRYTMQELTDYFRNKIEEHPIAGFITMFDHYAYTSAKPEHAIAEDIVDVKNVVFCFGKEIPHPYVPAVRPRSIAVCETKESFVISFMEAPNEKLTQVMIDWVEAL